LEQVQLWLNAAKEVQKVQCASDVAQALQDVDQEMD